MNDQVRELVQQFVRIIDLAEDDDYRALLTRYDDALKRINDLQSEIEALKIICRDAN